MFLSQIRTRWAAVGTSLVSLIELEFVLISQVGQCWEDYSASPLAYIIIVPVLTSLTVQSKFILTGNSESIQIKCVKGQPATACLHSKGWRLFHKVFKT